MFTLKKLWLNVLYHLGTRECKDLAIDVQCDHRTRQTRDTTEEDAGTYDVSIEMPVEA